MSPLLKPVTPATAHERLIFPLDGLSEAQSLEWVTLLAGKIGLFKVGLELFIRGGPELLRRIQDTGTPVFLDLKLHDIPATVEQAMTVIAELRVLMTTVHCDENPAMLEAAVRAAGNHLMVLGVTVLTSVNAGHLAAGGFGAPYQSDARQLVLLRASRAWQAGCRGVVCSGQEVALIREQFGPHIITVTPGIRPDWEGEVTDDQQRITTPGQAIANGSDFLVIGRPIRRAARPLAAVARLTADMAAAFDALNSQL